MDEGTPGQLLAAWPEDDLSDGDLAPLFCAFFRHHPKVTMLDDSIGISSADDDVVRLVNWYLTTADNTYLGGA
jgi:hypothetical protein